MGSHRVGHDWSDLAAAAAAAAAKLVLYFLFYYNRTWRIEIIFEILGLSCFWI